jgi:hypothetical protein
LRRDKHRPGCSVSFHKTFITRGGDGCDTFRDAKRITPDNDAPLMANEVMVYIRKLGTSVILAVGGRIDVALFAKRGASHMIT